MKKIIMIFVLALMLSEIPAFAADDLVLAKIGDRKIMMSDFNRMISYQDAEKQKLLEENPVYKATVLQRLVQSIAVSKIARDAGFDKRADVKEYFDLISDDFLATQYITKEIVNKINVSEDDMKLYYKIHDDEFKSPEMVRARHILIKIDKSASDEDKKKAKEKAEGILKRAKSGEDFARLASDFSDDVGLKARGGDLGFFPKGRMVPEFESAAFSLKPGEVSGIVETQFGFHIIKVEEKKESALEPYDKIKDKVKEKVFNEFRKARVEEFVEKAMKDTGVELNLDPFLPKDKK